MRPILLLLLVAMIASAVWLSFGRSSAHPGTVQGAPAHAVVEQRVSSASATAMPLTSPEPRIDVSARVRAVEPIVGASTGPAARAQAALRVRVVTKGAREPLRGVTVITWALTDEAGQWKETGRSVTDAEGLVAQEVAPERSLQGVIDSASGVLGNFQTGAIAPGQDREITVEIEQPTIHVLHGRVVASGTNAPIAGASFEFGPGRTAGTTDADGCFRADFRTWRDQGLTVRAVGFGPRWAAPEPGHETADRALEIVLERAATLRVTVIDARGAPVPDARVKLETNNRDLAATTAWQGSLMEVATWVASTRLDGVAVLEGLPAGVRLRAEVRRGELAQQPEHEPIVLTPGEERECTWRVDSGSELRGIVVEESGAPAPRVEVWIEAETARGGQLFDEYDAGNTRRKTTSDDAGRFQFADLAPGRWWVGLPPIGLRDHDPMREPAAFPQSIEITEQGAPNDVVVRLLRGLVIRGRIVGPDGSTAASGSVHALHDTARVSVSSIPHFEGEFVIGPLLPGTWTLSAWSDEGHGSSEPIEVACGATDVVLRLEPAGKLAVRVLDAAGAPVASVSVLAGILGGWPVTYATRADGIAEFDRLLGGAVCAGCTMPDGRWAMASGVSVDAGRTTSIDLVLEPGVRGRLRYSAGRPRALAVVMRDGAMLAYVDMGLGQTIGVGLPVGRVTLRAFGGNDVPIDHEVVIEPGTSPEFTFDGAWR